MPRRPHRDSNREDLGQGDLAQYQSLPGHGVQGYETHVQTGQNQADRDYGGQDHRSQGYRPQGYPARHGQDNRSYGHQTSADHGPRTQIYADHGDTAQDDVIPASSPSMESQAESQYSCSYSSSLPGASAGFDSEEPASPPIADAASLHSPLTVPSSSPSASGYSFNQAGMDTTAHALETSGNSDDAEDLAASVVTLNQPNDARVLGHMPSVRRPTLVGVGDRFQAEKVRRSTQGGEQVLEYSEDKLRAPLGYENQDFMASPMTTTTSSMGVEWMGDAHHPAARHTEQ